MGAIHTHSGAASPRETGAAGPTEPATTSPRIWLELNHRVRISSQTVRRVCREGLKLLDLDLVLRYGERVAEGYHMSDNAISQALQSIPGASSTALQEQLYRLRNVVVVEVMDTILTTYRLPAADQPRQGEFVLH